MKTILAMQWTMFTLLVGLMSCNEALWYGQESDLVQTSEKIKEVEKIVKDFSPHRFHGIASLSDITDSTVTLSWTPHTEAFQYEIYEVKGDHKELIKTVGSPASSTTITSLKEETEYQFLLNLVDKQGLTDDNTNILAITTLKNPHPPHAMMNQSPGYSPSLVKTPTIRVGGVKAGDTIKLYSDSTCTTNIGSALATSTTVDVPTTPLSAGAYTIHAGAIGIHNNPSPCSTVSVHYEAQFCPDGYIPIPGNPTFSTSDFCVMKYEAKAQKANDLSIQMEGGTGTESWADIYDSATNSSGYRPISTTTGLPWRWINQNDAKLACGNLGSGFALINNPEWMTIAHNIENQPNNWSNGITGDGVLSRGHSDNNPGGACDAALPNVQTNCGESGDSFDQTRTFQISNGESVWDMSGNVWEWIDWNIAPADKAYLASDNQPINGYIEFTSLIASGVRIDSSDPMATWTWSPLNTSLTNAKNIGRYYAGDNTSGGAALRGGRHATAGTESGLFTLHLGSGTGGRGSSVSYGFRCVYRP
jgi:hypothetical protein